MIDPITVSQVNKNTNVATSAIETTIGKSNSTDTTTIFGKLNQILNGSGGSGGDTQAFKNLIQRTGTEFKPPSGITKIGSNCCAGYTDLITVSLPESVTSIQSNAFTNCENLTTIILSSNITYLGSAVFYDCIKLNKVENFENIGIVNIPAHCFDRCTTLKGITLSNSVVQTGDYDFRGCNNLNWTSIPNFIKRIGDYAFSNCSNIIASTFTGNINSIGTKAFQNTKTDGQITFSTSNRLIIYSYAFANITDLNQVVFNGETPTSIANTAFKGCSNLHAIFVSWSEGEVVGAPWGATNAVITYTG